jgi:hypothetical protein
MYIIDDIKTAFPGGLFVMSTSSPVKNTEGYSQAQTIITKRIKRTRMNENSASSKNLILSSPKCNGLNYAPSYADKEGRVLGEYHDWREWERRIH